MKIYNKIKEINKIIGSLLVSLNYLEPLLTGNKLKTIAPELIDKLTSIIKDQKNLVEDSTKIIKALEKEEGDRIFGFIKKGNTIHISFSDGVSYIEHQFFHILNEKPDRRDMIEYEYVIVGFGDSSTWVRYEEKEFKKLEEFTVMLENHANNIELVDYDILEKYKNYSKNIPQC